MAKEYGVNDSKIYSTYPTIYKPTHVNHPCTIWAATNSVRYKWLRALGLALCDEFTYRYGKVHKSESIIKALNPQWFDCCFIDQPLEPFVQAMPDEYKAEDVVAAYRLYYINAKQDLLIYTKRQPPDWLPAGLATYKE